MKNQFLFIILFVSCIALSQKAKSSSTTKASSPAAKSSSLAKLDNLTLEIITESGMQKLALIVTKKDKKENVILKDISTKDKAQFPKDAKISVMNINSVKLYLITYTEIQIKEEKGKKETSTILTNEIWEISDINTSILSNKQITTNIKERQYFDKAKTASQDIERIRREGFEFKLNKDNTIQLFNKTQSTKYKFNPTSKKFEISK